MSCYSKPGALAASWPWIAGGPCQVPRDPGPGHKGRPCEEPGQPLRAPETDLSGSCDPRAPEMKTLLLTTALGLITVQAQDPLSFQDPDVRLTWGGLGWGGGGSVVGS